MLKKIYLVARLEDGGIIFVTSDFEKIIPVIEKELEELENYFPDVYRPTLEEQQEFEGWAESEHPNYEQFQYGNDFVVMEIMYE